MMEPVTKVFLCTALLYVALAVWSEYYTNEADVTLWVGQRVWLWVNMFLVIVFVCSCVSLFAIFMKDAATEEMRQEQAGGPSQSQGVYVEGLETRIIDNVAVAVPTTEVYTVPARRPMWNKAIETIDYDLSDMVANSVIIGNYVSVDANNALVVDLRECEYIDLRTVVVIFHGDKVWQQGEPVTVTKDGNGYKVTKGEE